MFRGRFEATKPWSMAGVEGFYRFLARVWRLAMTENAEGVWEVSRNRVEVKPIPPQNKVIHATIKKVTEDIESLAFNTAISQMMIYVNTFTNVEPKPVTALRTLLILLNPFAPHLTEDLWQRLSQRFSIFSGQISQQAWPNWDEAYLMEEEVEVVVQVNGKLRDRITVRKDLGRHAEGAPGEFIEAAKRAGLAEIGFSDHNPMPEPFDDWRMNLDELPHYLDFVAEARASGFPVRLGLECDFIPGRESWIEKLAGMAEWDYLIGSVHYLASG